MILLQALGTGVTVISALAFVLYLIGLFRLPTGKRPKTPTLNRFGEQIGMDENPGYEETEDEEH
jgi:hypothetical protein